MFLIFEGKWNSPGARCLLCTVYTVRSSIWSGQYGPCTRSTKLDVWTVPNPCSRTGLVWDPGRWDPASASSQPGTPASAAPAPSRPQVPLQGSLPTQFFPMLSDEENIFVILTVWCSEKYPIHNYEMDSTIPSAYLA